MTIHFICRGNAHRSLMAEAYLKSLELKDIRAISSGTKADLHRDENMQMIPGVLAILAKHGVDKFAKHNPSQLTQELVDSADINICMNKSVADDARKIVTLPQNTQIWDVNDTNEGNYVIKDGDDEFKYTELIYEQITNKVDALIRGLKLQGMED